MVPFASVQDFLARQAELHSRVEAGGKTIALCGGTACTAFVSPQVRTAFEREIREQGLEREIALKLVGCPGFCQQGPVAVIRPSNVFYTNIQVEDVPRLVEMSARGSGILEERLYVEPSSNQRIIHEQEVPFYARQMRRVLELNGVIDPLSLDDYIAHGGYAAAAKALAQMTPDQVIDEVREAGLRGRGGAGFPTGAKWGFCRKAPGSEKYLICNADEGDPGAFMDRSVLEGNPHCVLEGMIIAAYAVGAAHGIIYARAEYPLAVSNSRAAIEQAREAGLLGDSVLGTGFGFDIEVREGAGAFVCGEETALIASLEGRRGMPRARPPFPANSGYRGKPTNINNVETLAGVPAIILKGKDWYRSVGTEGSKGTKIFALAGKVNNTGLIEVPMGATLRQIVFDIGGGIPRNRRFKAVQMGGPSGGCVPAQFLDLPIDYESVKSIGAIMGSGGLIVMDENTCIVDIARFFLEFVQKESCGKCVPCRVGTRHMLDILNRICSGEGQEGDIERLERLAAVVKDGSLCGLGQTAPNPVLSTLRYFRDEYEEHIHAKHCRASVCEGMVEAPCAHACPAGVNVPQYVGLIAENRIQDAVDIIRRRNPFISVCGRVCDAPCESRCRRADADEPLAIRALKRYAADHASNLTTPMVPPARGGEEVAVVGSGPAGLSCAYFLALMGRRSVVFEALPIPGGMLSVGIPEYRLPKKSLQADIDYVLAHGVTLRTGTPVTDIARLKSEGYKAVFFATGAQTGVPLGIEGDALAGVVDATGFLRSRALGEDVACRGRVAVIGGGNAAVDAARSALRLGASNVMILYRRGRDEMPAFQEEIDAAVEEGIEILPLVAPKRVLGRSGRVTGVELTRMRLADGDASGRRRPVPIDGSEFAIECDMVIPAIGSRPSVEHAHGVMELNGDGGVLADPITGLTSQSGVFAGGDCVSGGSTVVAAIGDGQRAAVAIDRLLGGTGLLPPNVGTSLWRQPAEQLENSPPRAAEAMIPADRRRRSFAEVLECLTPGAACAESGRCLRCDLERLEALAQRRAVVSE